MVADSMESPETSSVCVFVCVCARLPFRQKRKEQLTLHHATAKGDCVCVCVCVCVCWARELMQKKRNKYVLLRKPMLLMDAQAFPIFNVFGKVCQHCLKRL